MILFCFAKETVDDELFLVRKCVITHNYSVRSKTRTKSNKSSRLVSHDNIIVEVYTKSLIPTGPCVTQVIFVKVYNNSQ